MKEKTKFEFPSKGFHLVTDKVAEADYFLGKMNETARDIVEFRYVFSAFVSAARSVTFILQAAMSDYPDFENWYPPRQQRLKQSELARFFVGLRNHLQKAGGAPLFHGGVSRGESYELITEFTPNIDFKDVPQGDVLALSEDYFRLLLEVLIECWTDYSAYVDPRAVYTLEGLDELSWEIEDLEEAMGFPRGYTDIPWSEDDKCQQRLKALAREGGWDEGSKDLMDRLFEKYGIRPDTDLKGVDAR